MNLPTKFAIISFLIIIFQSILKITAVLLTGSITLLSEAIDTIVDIFFAAMTLYSVYISEKPADFEHMFGHQKIDSIGGLVQGVILSVIYFLLIFNSVQIILEGSYQVTNPGSGIILILISFTVNIVYSRILIWQGTKQKSLSLRVQGLNLFQDSLRSILVLVSLFFSFYGFVILDPFFAIILSIFIIYSSLKLSKEGIEELTDTNPLNSMIIKELIEYINKIEHVNGIDDLKVRASGRKLFIEIVLLVEDHISMTHADRITKAINSLTEKLFPLYDPELIIQMNPKGGESTISEKVINLIRSIKEDHPEILRIKDINLFEFKNEHFVSMTMVVEKNLTLKEAHEVCTAFEEELKDQINEISRIITHFESEEKSKIKVEEISCKGIENEKISEIREKIENILKAYENVKGYHGLECWNALNRCMIELHIFFKGQKDITEVHQDVERIEGDIRKLNIKNLENVYLHSEPLEGRTDGIIFS
ncbi:MAG: cation diffusion facilitator family transporter [Promethearchaeia archaeon]